jgi:hypothetical protein
LKAIGCTKDNTLEPNYSHYPRNFLKDDLKAIGCTKDNTLEPNYSHYSKKLFKR